MADNFRFAQLQPYSLYGAGAIIGATSITLQSMTDIDGNALSMSGTFGSIGYGTLDPGNGTLEEQISFTGLVNNSNGTVTLTGVSTVLFTYPYTATSGLAKTHAGATPFVISNTSGFYDKQTSKDNNETINQVWTFATGATPLIIDQPVSNTEAANKLYVDTVAIAGAPDASDVTKGITKLSVAAVSPTSPIAVGDNDTRVPTQAENNALVGNNTDIAVGTGNKYVTQTGLQVGAEVYAASATGNDTYVVTLSPVPIAYVNGMTIRFKTDVANTGAATLNVNGLGAIAITKLNDVALATGDIEANQIVEVTYNSTGPKFQMQSQTAQVQSPVDYQVFTGSGTWTKPSDVSANSYTTIQAWGAGGGGGSTGGSNGNGGGGGGGDYNELTILTSLLAGTETVTIGTGAAATAGGNSTFGSWLTAYGGAAGGNETTSGGGGGGAGVLAKGADASGATSGAGGSPAGGAATGAGSGLGGGGGASTNGNHGGATYWGGGGGGTGFNAGTGGNGGASTRGGGGGAGGGSAGGGSGGASIYGGAGGAGGTGNADGTAGSAPAGGGGGSSRTSAGTRVGGAGGRGEIRVWTTK